MKNSLADKAREIRKKAASTSLEAFARTYLAEHLKFEPSAAHVEVYGILTSSFAKRGLRLALAAPRKFGKSTMFTLIYILYSICYKKDKFDVIISETAEQARKILDNVKTELTTNKLLKEDFPEVCEMDKAPKPPRWRVDDIVTRNGIQVLALGSGQKIRGRRHGASRPTTVFLDDIESEESVKTLEQREKLKDWFTKSVLNVGSEETNFFFIGNLHHHNCLLAEYTAPDKHPDWHKKIYKAIISEPANTHLWDQWVLIRLGRMPYSGFTAPGLSDDFYDDHEEDMEKGAQTIWPSRWNYKELRQQRENDPRTFSSEMQNEPVNPEACPFDMEKAEYWNKVYPSAEHLIHAVGQDKLEFYAACDPSTGTARGDFSAIIVLLKDRVTKALYVVVADIERVDDITLIRKIVDYQARFRPVQFVYETNNFQRLLVHQIEEESRKRAVLVPLKELKSTGDKRKRVEGLYSWVRNGTIKFSEAHRLLIDQMRDFPQGRHDDGPDALEMAVTASQGSESVNFTVSEMKDIFDACLPHPDLTIIDPITGQKRYFRGERF